MTQSAQPTLLVISQVFPPDPTAVGQYIHDAAVEMVRRGWRVVVYTANRGYTDPSQKYAAREIMHGVEVRRLPLSSFGKGSIPVRLLAQILFTMQVALRGMFVSRLKCVLVSTSPPMAGVAALWLKLLRRATVNFWVMDLNVDQMVASGSLSPRSLPARMLRWAYRRTLHGSSEIVALDRFMQQRIADGYGVSRHVHVIPPWPHDDELEPVPHETNPFRREHGLEGKFVFMYSGNMGIGHPLGALLEAARRLEDLPNVAFVFIGAGVRRKEVEAAIRDRRPPNLLLLPYQPYDQLRYSLSAADVHLVSMDDTGVGCFHPCKVYGAMAVARPVLFAGPQPSHMTDLIERYSMGWRIPSDDPAAAAETMRMIVASPPGEVAAMGQRARRAVTEDLSKAALCKRFCEILGTAAPAAGTSSIH
jgi:glycosyltransferase involved in cell wall biosynthesis